MPTNEQAPALAPERTFSEDQAEHGNLSGEAGYLVERLFWRVPRRQVY